jgi:hypothetical protein
LVGVDPILPPQVSGVPEFMTVDLESAMALLLWSFVKGNF